MAGEELEHEEAGDSVTSLHSHIVNPSSNTDITNPAQLNNVIKFIILYLFQIKILSTFTFQTNFKCISSNKFNFIGTCDPGTKDTGAKIHSCKFWSW